MPRKFPHALWLVVLGALVASWGVLGVENRAYAFSSTWTVENGGFMGAGWYTGTSYEYTSSTNPTYTLYGECGNASTSLSGASTGVHITTIPNTISGSVSVDPSNHEWLDFSLPVPSPPLDGSGGWSTDGISFYTGSWLSSSTLSAMCGSTLTVQSDPPPSTAPTSTLLFPSTSSVIPDFTSWVVGWANAPTSSTGYARAGVCYGLNSDDCTSSDTQQIASFSISPLVIRKANRLWYIPLSDPVTWNAYAFIENASGTIVASSSDLTFYVSPNASTPTSSYSGLALPFFTSSASSSPPIEHPLTNCNATSSGFWDSTVVGFQNGICTALTYLFIPDDPHMSALQDGFSSIGDDVKNKPPFGYITSAVVALQSFNESTSTATTTLADATTTAEIYTVTQPLDQGISIVITFMLLMWIFHRGRHFEPT